MKCEPDALLALVHGDRGELTADRARELEAHAEGCAACADELAWLRTERALFLSRGRTHRPPAAWPGIERRVAVAGARRAARRRAWLSGGAVAAFAVAAAAALWIAARADVKTRGGVETASTRKAAAQRDASTGPGLGLPAPGPGEDLEAERTFEPPVKVLDDAEVEVQGAIHTLEAAWAQKREQLDPEEVGRIDAELEPYRRAVMELRAAVPGDDIVARRRALHAYSAYMRTIQAVVLEERP